MISVYDEDQAHGNMRELWVVDNPKQGPVFAYHVSASAEKNFRKAHVNPSRIKAIVGPG